MTQRPNDEKFRRAAIKASLNLQQKGSCGTAGSPKSDGVGHAATHQSVAPEPQKHLQIQPVIYMQKKWLHALPWDSVLSVNQALCQAQKLEPTTKVKSLDEARRLWETAMPRSLSLKEVLDVCRECHELSPFTFNNGNTFAALGRTIIEEWTKSLPPVEAQIVQTTVCHYIAGLIGRRELLQVLKHFEQSLNPVPVRQDPVRQETPVLRTGVPPVLTEAHPQA